MILLAFSILWALAVTALLTRAITQYRHYPIVRPEPASGGAAPAAAALVTAIVPARNEARIIGRCIAALQAQDYPREALRIVVVDDNSEDRTATIVQAFAVAGDARVRLMPAGPLPPGWLGKPHACSVAAKTTLGAPGVADDWLCFIDADTIGQPPLIRTAVREATRRGLDLVSLQPRQDLVTPAERLILPAGFFLIAFTQDLRRTNDPATPDASVNGQFLLIRRAAYEAVGGHVAVRDAVAEDSALAGALKAAGHRVAVLGTEGLLHTRMYEDVRSLSEGAARQAASLLGGTLRLLAAALAALVLVAAAVGLPAADAARIVERGIHAATIVPLAFAAAASLALLGTHVGAARYFRIPAWYGALFPFSYLAGAGILVYAAWQRARHQTRWKGRVYPAGAPPREPTTPRHSPSSVNGASLP